MNWKKKNDFKFKKNSKSKNINKRLLDLKIKFFIKKKFGYKEALLKENNKYGEWIIK